MEVYVHRSSHHPNIVRYVDSYIVGAELWLVTESMGCGRLVEVLEKHRQVPLSEEHIALVCREVRIACRHHTLPGCAQ